MPVTGIELPILSQFLCAVESNTGMPAQPLDAEKAGAPAPAANSQTTHADDDAAPKKLPKGVVLGKDGKPCRSCTSFASWAAMAKKQTVSPSTISTTTPPAAATSELQPPADCPPDVDSLGRSSWALLHSITATYPTSPSPEMQRDTSQFISLFSKLYPCWVCAEDFQSYIKEQRPRVSSREEFGRWMCEAHNAVNVRLGKERFDCGRWEERWRTGWRDGRCD